MYVHTCSFPSRAHLDHGARFTGAGTLSLRYGRMIACLRIVTGDALSCANRTCKRCHLPSIAAVKRSVFTQILIPDEQIDPRHRPFQFGIAVHYYQKSARAALWSDAKASGGKQNTNVNNKEDPGFLTNIDCCTSVAPCHITIVEAAWRAPALHRLADPFPAHCGL